jgi:hypothetical protein
MEPIRDLEILAFMRWSNEIANAENKSDLATAAEGWVYDDRLTQADRDVLELLSNAKEWGLNWSQKKNSG